MSSIYQLGLYLMFLKHPYIIKVRGKNEEEEQKKNVQ